MARPSRVPVASPIEEGNRRAELIRTAGRLFREKGFEATTIRDIAAAVGMRSGSPFYHFKSKQDLLKAVMIEGLDAALVGMRAVAGRGAPPEAIFRDLVHAHLRLILDPANDFSILLYEWRSLTDESRVEVIAAKDRYEEVWRVALEPLVAEGRIGGGRLAHLFVFGALNWIVQWYHHEGGLSIEQVAQQAVDFLLRP